MGGIVAASILQGHRINTLRFDRQCFQRAGEEYGGGTVTKNVDGVVRRMGPGLCKKTIAAAYQASALSRSENSTTTIRS